MNEEEQLRDGLETVDVPPSRIEVDMLVRAGRRRAVRRHSVQAAGGTALAIAALLAVPSILTGMRTHPAVQARAGQAPVYTSASTPTTTAPDAVGPCRMTILPVLGGMKDVEAVGIDPTGKYIIGVNTVGQNFQSLLWTDGQPQALPMRGTSVQATAVNASGVVVGLVDEASGSGNEEYAFRYENGAYTRLQTPPGNWRVFPTPVINAAGDVVINAEPSDEAGTGISKDDIVLLWKAGSTTAIKLPLPAGANAFAIADDGTIVGTMYKDGKGVAAYAWDQQGNGRKLKVPADQTGAAYAARGKWATGGLWPSGSHDATAVLWNLQTGDVTRLGAPKPGTGVNAAGWVIDNGSVLRDGTTVELALPSGQTSYAQGVSDSGTVAGYALLANGRDKTNMGPRLWHC